MNLKPSYSSIWDFDHAVDSHRWQIRRRFRLSLADCLFIAAMVAACVIQVIR